MGKSNSSKSTTKSQTKSANRPKPLVPKAGYTKSGRRSY